MYLHRLLMARLDGIQEEEESETVLKLLVCRDVLSCIRAAESLHLLSS